MSVLKTPPLTLYYTVEKQCSCTRTCGVVALALKYVGCTFTTRDHVEFLVFADNKIVSLLSHNLIQKQFLLRWEKLCRCAVQQIL